ncbi:MAG: sulfatase-like hydrolase/transferase, partial [Planctomycetaceae bacterium]
MLAFRVCVAASSVWFAAACVAADAPNVVMIISDDQGWTEYGFMGHEHVKTPHIDRLAKESLTFTRGYVPDSLCRPSLATLITGLYPHQHGIVGNNPPLPEDLQAKPRAQQRRDPRYLEIETEYLETHIDRAPKLPVMLHEKLGYLSHQSGKWWEGHYSRGGFTHGMTHGDRTRGGRHGDEGLTIGRQGLDPIYEFIETAETQDKPFFIWYAPFMPHSPHNPPQRLLAKYRDKTPHLQVAKYWAMCEWFDETVGQLLNHLDEQG